MEKRRQFIRDNYSLTLADGVWVARTSVATYTDTAKSRLINTVRCMAGHFNFQDEAEEFGKIFPPQH